MDVETSDTIPGETPHDAADSSGGNIWAVAHAGPLTPLALAVAARIATRAGLGKALRIGED